MQVEDIGSFDAIVIGSGMSGLFAGNSLAKKGYRVLLLEKHVAPGGYTVNFERKGFRFEASNHFIGGCEPGGMAYENLVKIDAKDRIEFLNHESFACVVDEARGIEYWPPWQLAEYVDLLAKLFPHQEEGIQGFYRKYEAKLIDLFGHLAKQMEEGAERGQITDAMEQYLGLKGKSAQDLMDEYVSDPELMGMMAGIMSGSLGVSYDELDATIFVMGDIASRLRGGFTYYPKGGSGNMTRILADLFQEKGGALLLRREVTEMTFSKGLVDGVIAKKRNGELVSARGRCVVAASDLTLIVNHLCPEGTFPADYVKSVNERTPGRSCVMLFAGLDIDLRERGITAFEFMRTWGETMTPALLKEIAREGDYSKLPNAHVAIYSNLDPSCCPEGKSVITTMDLADPELFESSLDPGRKRGRAYEALKKRITSQLLQKAARALDMPNLERYVEVLEVATPVTLERYTGNRGGSFVGWKWTPELAVQGHFSQQSPVENLFLCGHWVSPGGGVNFVMTGGINAAELADAYLR
ncbi:MAG: NAD(P)/FAD-dependent oxidoreductase [Deltaproteobacteria bacterium]|nr:NAD(P)/FAD-dependent oxidoreductase [Deltaproteobacteria bacterium]